MQTTGDAIRVLHVDDEPEFVEMAATFIEAEDGRLDVEPVTSVSDGLERLAADEFNCIVSDYDMPGQNGIEFLETVRDEYSDLPFILYTGKGSEEVASEAISAGVTDYLQKKGGTEQYELLANRIRTSVEGYLAQQEADWQETIIENMGEGVYVFDDAYTLQYVNFRVSDIDVISEEDWAGRPISYFEATELLSPAEIEEVKDGIDRILDDRTDECRLEIEPSLPESVETLSLRLVPVRTRSDENLVLATSRDITGRKERERSLQELKRQYETLAEHFPDGAVYLIDADFEYVRARGKELRNVGLSPDEIEGKTPHDLFPKEIADELCEAYTRALEGTANTIEQVYQGERYRVQTAPVRAEEGSIDQLIAVSQNITESARKKERLERQNERLEEFASVVSHDLRNPLNVADGRLELARQECDSEHLDVAGRALTRMETLIEDLLALAQQGLSVGETTAVALADLAESCWQAVETADATLSAETDCVIQADPKRCQQLLENLIRNCVEHGGEDVTITVGALDDGDGFYVADDGPGIPTDEREAVFKSGYSTTDGGSGFGLAIVREIVQAHGWAITVTESEHGGARFEISGVEQAC
ncbi:PAS domain-containing protein [Haloarcula pelagica]|uniref:hybrid sensor histidine kinase/response regulator n=1 Tax=Haloarcula pelagica TaxID=3033389 RepID=UPI0024C4105B|nr:PAS domain-containing protein [Halomicroarcula sp. YJ-61-S]